MNLEISNPEEFFREAFNLLNTYKNDIVKLYQTEVDLLEYELSAYLGAGLSTEQAIDLIKLHRSTSILARK